MRNSDGLDGENDMDRKEEIRRGRESKRSRFARAYVTADLQQRTGSSSENRREGGEK